MISLEVGPNGENIHVEKQPDGYYAAYDQDNYDLGCPVRCGQIPINFNRGTY